MTTTKDDLYAADYFEYLKNRSAVRKRIRRFYLKDIAGYCTGKTIDFGCGVGELLQYLDKGSLGLEVNPVAVHFCKAHGMEVNLYDPETDQYRLSMIPEHCCTTFTMNHVLEHIENAAEVVSALFKSCHRLGIKRIVLTVPGIKGYASDPTHRSFIDQGFFEKNKLWDNPYYTRVQEKHFPVNSATFGEYFTHNEWRIIFNARHD
jgi:hypothetical protein